MINKIALIGMPSAGKTTVGFALAQKLGYDFKDLDTMVEKLEGASLIEIMNSKGADYFRNMEYKFITQIHSNQKIVISPAGSIIFQEDAVKWLQANTCIFFLDTPFEVIENRLTESPKAVFGLKERGLKNIWEERRPLYNLYANHIIDTRDKNVDGVVHDILHKLQ